MNILFINHGEITNNSGSHIAPLACELTRLGCSVAVAVPKVREGDHHVFHDLDIPLHRFPEDDPVLFPDRRSADVIHAWTPREHVRGCLFTQLRHGPAATIIHLEDNEEYLHEMRLAEAKDNQAGLPRDCIDPRLFRPLLELADGLTVLHPALSKFCPDAFIHRLWPVVDPHLFREGEPSKRENFGIPGGEILVFHAGHDHFANERNIRILYESILETRRRGHAVRLLRAGRVVHSFPDMPSGEFVQAVTQLGILTRRNLIRVLKMSDMAIQPGPIDAFNGYRVPSALPEYLFAGKPVLACAGDGYEIGLVDGENFLSAGSGTASEFSDALESAIENRAHAQKIGENAATLARAMFDPARVAKPLLNYYREILADPKHALDFLHLGTKPLQPEAALFWPDSEESQTPLDPAVRRNVSPD